MHCNTGQVTFRHVLQLLRCFKLPFSEEKTVDSSFEASGNNYNAPSIYWPDRAAIAHTTLVRSPVVILAQLQALRLAFLDDMASRRTVINYGGVRAEARLLL